MTFSVPLFLLGLTGAMDYTLPNGDNPFVVIDFENGVYQVGGVSKTLAEVCAEDLVNWGYDFDPLTDVVQGVGFAMENGGPAIIGDALSYLIVGRTILVDYSLFTDEAWMWMFDKDAINDTNSQWYLKAGAGAGTACHYADATSASEDYPTPSTNGAHKVAITQLPGTMEWSVDGGAVQTVVTEDWTPAPDFFGLYMSDGNPGSVVRSILFYPAQNADDLPGLSAL